MNPFLIMFLVSAATTAVSVYAQSQAAEAAASQQEKQAKTQELSTQYKIDKSQADEATLAVKYLQRNRMVAESRGEALNSPGFNAIQIATLKHSQEALQADTTYEEVNKLSTEQKLHAIDANEHYKIMGSIIGGLSSIASSGMQAEEFNQMHQ